MAVGSCTLSSYSTRTGVLGAKRPAAGDKGVWGQSSQWLTIWGIYYQNNPFLGILQLKFYLKNLRNLFIIVRLCTKCSILAIILLNISYQIQVRGRGGAKKIPGPPLLPTPMMLNFNRPIN